MAKDNGIFVISLDFELHWGLFDVVALEDKKKYFQNTLRSIPKVLETFESHSVSATWATVGMLFNADIEELKRSLPKVFPNYENEKLSAYSFIDKHLRENQSDYYFAPELIKKIIATAGQEIGTHTYSHYYTLAKGQTAEAFAADLDACIEKAQDFGVSLQSIVYPRNQLNEAYNDIAANKGICALRTNPDVWFWNAKSTNDNSFMHRVFRTIDMYFPLRNALLKTSDLRLTDGKILKLPFSRFYKPRSKYGVLNYLRQQTIKREMTKAARQGKYYHLWWHPHNFGTNPQQSHEELEELMNHYHKLHNKYNFQSMTMGEVYDSLKN